MKKTLILFALVMGVSMSVMAQHKVPAYPGVIDRVQPNGDTLRTYLRGDEHQHFAMTVDGWQIKECKHGWLKYAKTKRNGEVVASCRKAHNEANRSKCEKRWLEKHGIKKH